LCECIIPSMPKALLMLRIREGRITVAASVDRPSSPVVRQSSMARPPWLHGRRTPPARGARTSGRKSTAKKMVDQITRNDRTCSL